ncbi:MULTISPECIES: phage distal tail protein [unclassified Nonomuraea]|uniref:phage distal tail protein n=1 Tax=unclassified Nonomuraea TaxID=2593643 RepID=UPI0033C86009
MALPAFESVSEWPALAITTPNVDLALPVFESISEWPALTLTYEQSFALPVFESVSEWPALTVTIPVKPGDSLTGANGEAEWNGTLWGPTTSIRVLLPVEGWLGTPSVDNLNVEKPAQHGAWDALKLSQQRVVTLRLQANSATDPLSVDDLLEQVIAATGLPESEDPLPLVIKAYGAPRLAYGQVIDRPITMDGDYNAGLPTVGVLIACGDPRLYGLDPRGATVALNTPTALANAGNSSTHPLIRLKGPLTDPTLVNQALDRTLQFTITLSADQILEIDTANGTVTLDGVSKMSTLGGVSDPVSDFVLKAGSNLIQYTTAADGTNGADLTWRDATI